MRKFKEESKNYLKFKHLKTHIKKAITLTLSTAMILGIAPTIPLTDNPFKPKEAKAAEYCELVTDEIAIDTGTYDYFYMAKPTYSGTYSGYNPSYVVTGGNAIDLEYIKVSEYEFNLGYGAKFKIKGNSSSYYYYGYGTTIELKQDSNSIILGVIVCDRHKPSTVSLTDGNTLIVGDNSPKYILFDGVDCSVKGMGLRASSKPNEKVRLDWDIYSYSFHYPYVYGTEGGSGSINFTLEAKMPKNSNYTYYQIYNSEMTIPVNVISPTTALTLTNIQTTLNVGQTNQLTTTLTPADAYPNTITYSSTNTSVATISAAGLVTAVAPGTTTIKALEASSGKYQQYTLTVVQPITWITRTYVGSYLYVPVGGTVSASSNIAITPANATNKVLSYTTSVPSKGTVNASGLITGVSAGTFNVTATATDGSGKSVLLNCYAYVPATSTAISNVTKDYVYVGSSISLTSTVTPSNANISSTTYSSSNPTIASVSGSTLTFNSPGTVTITVTKTDVAGGIKTSTKIFKVASPLTGIDLTTTYPYRLDGDGDLIVELSGDGTATLPFTATASPLTSAVNNFKWSILGYNDNNMTVQDSTSLSGVTATNTIYVNNPGYDCLMVRNIEESGAWFANIVSVIPPSSIALSGDISDMRPGEELTLGTTISPATATETGVTYSSSNPSVATVDSTGKVTAVSTGSFTITATSTYTRIDGTTPSIPYDGFVQEPVTSVAFNDLVIAGHDYVGKTITCPSYTVYPLTATHPEITLTLEDGSTENAIAKINPDNTITLKSPGVFKLKATSINNPSATSVSGVYTVYDYINGVDFNVDSIKINEGDTSDIFGLNFLPLNTTNPEEYTYTLSESVTGLISIDQIDNPSSIFNTLKDLKLTALQKGNTTLTATSTLYPTLHDSVNIIVWRPVDSVAFNDGDTLSIDELSSGTLGVTINPAGSSDESLTFTSSDPSIITVDTATGNYTALSKGSATITVSSVDNPSATDTITLSSKRRTADVKFFDDPAQTYVKDNIPTSQSYQLSWNVIPNLGPTMTGADLIPYYNTCDDNSVTFSTSDTTVATVSETGLVTPLKSGTVTITVKTNDGNFNDTINLTFNVNITAVEFITKDLTLYEGQTSPTTFKMELTDDMGNKYNSDNSTLNLTDFMNQFGSILSESYSVADTSIGEIVEEYPTFATVNPLLKGSTTLSYSLTTSFGVLTDFTSFTVKRLPESVNITDIPSLMHIGDEPFSIQTEVLPSGSDDVLLKYSSSDDSILTIDSSGVLTPVSNGVASITVNVDGTEIKDSKEVEVKTHLSSLSFEDASYEVYKGYKFTPNVIINPTSSSYDDLSYSVEDNNILSVDSSTGEATGLSIGTCNLSVTELTTGIHTEVPVTVRQGADNISVSSNTINIDLGDYSKSIEVSISPDDRYLQGYTFENYDSNIIKVSSIGEITPLSKGTTSVKVITEDRLHYTIVTVNVNGGTKFEGVTQSKDAIVLYRGYTNNFTLNFSPADHEAVSVYYRIPGRKANLYPTGAYIGSANGVTKASYTLVFKGLELGTDELIYTIGGVETHVPIHILEAPDFKDLTISLNETNISMNYDSTKTLSVSNNFSDYHPYYIWSSSDDNIVNVDTRGNLTSSSLNGTVVITVMDVVSGKSTTCSIRVPVPKSDSEGSPIYTPPTGPVVEPIVEPPLEPAVEEPAVEEPKEKVESNLLTLPNGDVIDISMKSLTEEELANIQEILLGMYNNNSIGTERNKIAYLLDLIFSFYSETVTERLYSDVDTSTNNYESIERVLLFLGYEDNSFHPYEFASRAELAQVLYMLPYVNKYIYSSDYSDVSEEDWFYKPVVITSGNELYFGYDDGTFKPYTSVSQKETAMVFERLLQKEYPNFVILD